MSAPDAAVVAGPTLRIRGTPYPVLLPRLHDPRLHLAAVIVSLQVLGQVAFEFDLSIAQILVALGTCAVLEVGIAFARQHMIIWPASAMLTGNGVAFVLRVPGTEHGDWWSMRGWWIFAATAAVGLLSKYVVRFRDRHVFNPSNIGLVLCFLLLGPELAEPLDFWWGPMSPWLALALAIIVTGGFLILGRLRLVGIAVGFWLAFAAGIALLVASGHAMSARWHLGPVEGWTFWRILVFSPEVLVFLFFMITDPKTIPAGRTARRVYGVTIGLLATLLIAPQTTEYASKVALLGALALVCAVRPLLEWLLPEGAASSSPLRRLGARGLGAAALTAAAAFAGLVVLAGLPARPGAESARAATVNGELPHVTVVPSSTIASEIDEATATRIATDIVADLRSSADALRRRDEALAATGAGGEWLADLRRQIRSSRSGAVVVPEYEVDDVRLTLEPGEGQGPPLVVAALEGSLVRARYGGSTGRAVSQGDRTPFQRTVELVFDEGRFLIVGTRDETIGTPAAPVAAPVAPLPLAGYVAPHLKPVSDQVGLVFWQSSFRYTVTPSDPVAMMGAGVCWLDYDGDGWMDLFAVNSYSELDVARWKQEGGLPRSALFHNKRGRFVDVSSTSGADVSLRGNGCVAADFDLDGRTDLYVTSSTYDALLWNDGDGTFTEGARAAGIDMYGWHAGAAVGDVNGDGRPDLYVAGYTNLNAPAEDSLGGFPSRYQGVRDLLYLNEGPDASGRPHFREVGTEAGLDRGASDHSLGAVLSDLDRDGRLDLYVANDEDPNRLYRNVPGSEGTTADPDGLDFRFENVAATVGVADANAGMGIAAEDYSGDGETDLLVTNSRDQVHAVYKSSDSGRSFTDVRSNFDSAFGGTYVGWGVSWVDLDLDGALDLVLANGAIPVKDLADDAQPLQVLWNRAGRFVYANTDAASQERLRLNGRGLAAADYDNDGDLDIAVNTIGGQLTLLENTNPRGHWLEVALDGFHPGATVTAVLPGGRKLVRDVHAGSSYLSSEDPRLHFGLGKATGVTRLVVRYPDGKVKTLRGVAANQVLHIEQ
jgi:ASPIC and UnbV/FG-GAP-like repeat